MDFGKVIKNLVIQCGHEFIGYIDDYNAGGEVIGTYNQIKSKYSSEEYEIALAIGYNNLPARMDVANRIMQDEYTIATLVHPQAIIDPSVKIGNGCLLMRGAIIDVNVTLDNFVVVWPGVVINHDTYVGTNTFVSPNATICGFVNIGYNSFVGAAAVVINNTCVPNQTFIKAGKVYYTSKSGGDE